MGSKKKAKKIAIYFSAILLSIFIFSSDVANAAELGETAVFRVEPEYDSLGRSQANATLRGISQKAYFYVTDDYWNSLSGSDQVRMLNLMNTLAGEFDNYIYTSETSFFGLDPQPGVDLDNRTTLVLSALTRNVGGYFDSGNSYPRTFVPTSNERDMIFLNAKEYPQADRLLPFLIHELQHLISFNQKEINNNVFEDVWLNELRSEYAVTVTGYNSEFQGSTLQSRMNSFFLNPLDSLTEWRNTISDYAQISALGEYIAENWGVRIIGDSTKLKSVGVQSISDTLLQLGFQDTFTEVFQYWMTANFLNDTSKNILFGYTHPNLKDIRVAPTQTFNDIPAGGISLAIQMRPWEQRWYDIQLSPVINSYLQVSFDGASLNNLRMPYLVFTADGDYKYKVANANRGNVSVSLVEDGERVTRVILMPYLQQLNERPSAFETAKQITMRVDRTDTPVVIGSVKPEDFGLREGDFIRAVGDKDVYIINSFGYKRIVLSPEICLLYGHLGARGCFNSIRTVETNVRDSFLTSDLYSNGHTKDGKVFRLVETGEDSAYLDPIVYEIDNSVFFINSLEQSAYSQ